MWNFKHENIKRKEILNCEKFMSEQELDAYGVYHNKNHKPTER